MGVRVFQLLAAVQKSLARVVMGGARGCGQLPLLGQARAANSTWAETGLLDLPKSDSEYLHKGNNHQIGCVGGFQWA